MDRRYYRQYENFDTVVPRIEDFPVLGSDSADNKSDASKIQSLPASINGLKIDDLVLVGILVLLLMEDEKDTATILSIAFLFLAEYIF